MYKTVANEKRRNGSNCNPDTELTEYEIREV